MERYWQEDGSEHTPASGTIKGSHEQSQEMKARDPTWLLKGEIEISPVWERKQQTATWTEKLM